MRILTIVYEYPPVGGGGGRVAQDVCRRLVMRGHEVTVLTMRAPGLPTFEIDEGVKVRRVYCFRRHSDRCSVAEMAAFVLIGSETAIRMARYWKPNVVHAHFAVPSGAIAWFVRKVSSIPYMITCHLGDVPGGVPEQTTGLFRWLAPMIHPIWRDASAVSAVSSFVQELAQRAYAIQPDLILNGVALDRISPADENPGSPCRLFFAGRLVGQKDLETALAALAELQNLAWTLNVAGDGPRRRVCEALVERYDLKGRIIFLGWISPDAVDKHLGDADILLLPSTSEGLPIIGARAVAHGVALVASDIPGNADVARPGENALTFPVKDVAGCREALRRLISNVDELRSMKRNSRSRATLFDINESVSRYERKLKDIAAV